MKAYTNALIRPGWLVMLVIILLAAAFPAGQAGASASSSSTISTGRGPHAVAVNQETSRVYVANADGDTVTVLQDTYEGVQAVAAVQTGMTPYAVALNPVTNKIYVVNADSDNVTVIDGRTNDTVTVPVGVQPFAVAVNSVTNKIYVANVGSGNVTVIDGASNLTQAVPAGESPFALAVNEATNQVYVANIDSDSVTVIEGTTLATETILVGAGPNAIAVNPNTNRVYVANFFGGNVTVIDGETGHTTAVQAGTAPSAVAVNKVTDTIYVANDRSGNVTIIDGTDNSTSVVQAGEGASALAIYEDGNKIYVANYDSDNVTIIDGASHATSLVATGRNPIALAVDPVTAHVYVANFNGNSMTTIEELRTTEMDLSSLTVNDGELIPVFDPLTSGYVVHVGNEIAELTVTATTYHEAASIVAAGHTYGNSAVLPVQLHTGANELAIQVQAPDGQKIRLYSLTIYRAEAAEIPLSANADLRQLTISAGALQPAFAAGTYSYSAAVNHAVDSLSITASTYAPGATMKINGVTQASGVPLAVNLQVGSNTVTVSTTSEDGTTSRSYSVLINRAGVSTVPETPAGGTSNTPAATETGSNEMTIVPGGIKLGLAAATTGVNTDTDGTSMYTAMLRADTLTKAFGKLQDNAQGERTLTFEIAGTEQVLRVGIPAKVLRDSAPEAAGSVIKIQTDNADYQLPVRLPSLLSFLQQLGTEQTDEAIVYVAMRTITGTEAKQFVDQLAKTDIQLIGDIVEFTLYVETSGKRYAISDFGGTYVTRSLYVADPVDPSRSTAVVIDLVSGTVSFVPSVFKTTDGITEATIYRNANSLYAIARSEKTFADLLGHWSKADVDLLASKRIVKGMSETDFAPEHNVTRAEFVSLVVRALGLVEDASYAGKFRDISAEDWFAGAVGAASRASIIDGFEDGSFRPGETITREQMAVMLSNALTFAGKAASAPGKLTLYAFEDHADIRLWAEAAMAHMIQSGIFTGVTDTRLAPQDTVTRAQAAVSIKRLLQNANFIN
ncbi:S-layer homology domain-containing protein [Paenibacillus contaminans]|uniref:SLH domain-containing protein n=1 Tax=Paenibacillus contaminans TaxID=450362 RepID=A0A329MW68_9BACL|nr:S-layer homology domain-containing protein [Paenibacillus contaminans]RAV23076.1 hypothetical protein DQG23_02445 [Paenibacillus contaminans]